MAIRIAVGDESFDEIRKAGLYYIDKTELLYDLVGRMDNKVTLFTRPRRFGKTLSMSMMESFFDINRDSKAVFEGLHIMKHQKFCSSYMNQYPVLFISFKGVEDLSYDNAYSTLQLKIAEVCKKHEYLYVSDKVNEADRQEFRHLMFGESSLAEIKNSVKTIMRMMNAVYGKPVILLIDEYDVPLAKASENNDRAPGYYQKMLNVIRGIFEAALKTNEYLKFAVVTGCLRIAKESIFTGTNNFMSYSVLDKDFSEYFGFTQGEVDRLLAETGCIDKADIIREWYDGYVFGNSSVYCPWDVASYVAALLRRKDAEPKNYWRNTSSNSVIRDFVNHSDWGIPDKFETIMNGGTITVTVSDELTYDTLHESEQNLWSILLMTGYLTKADPTAKGQTVALKIPNTEIAGIFEDTVVKLFTDTLDNSKQKELMSALWNEDIEGATQKLNGFLWDTISYHDYHEDYYHAFMAGLFVGLGYSVDSNKESGLGRFDIRVKDRKNRRFMIIEVKKADSATQMNEACDEAIKQIVDKGYAKAIEPGYERNLCYGVAFFQKSSMIKKL